MILIGEVLVSEDLVKKNFACNLNACKGACCIEGDYGAPLSKNELLLIDELLETVLPYLPEASQKKINEKGFSTYNDEVKIDETSLMEDGACVFMGRNELGITFCGIEKAYYDKKISFKKPISCHLYPIRVKKNKDVGFEALNYDKWEICDAACENGSKKKILIYEFARDAIIRQYGEEFYKDLDAAAKNLGHKS